MREATAKFLARLDSEATSFTFQMFDDIGDRKDPNLTRSLHGPLAEHYAMLTRLNAQGAGIFVTVNEADGKGRKTCNITRVRAVFVDLDGAPLEPVLAFDMKPHIVVESSPGRWHGYPFRNRPPWSTSASVGKTPVSSAMIDGVAARLGRTLFEVPDGFKWFVVGR